MSEHRLTLATLTLEGFDDSRSAVVEAEIRNVLNLFVGKDLDLLDDVQMTVIITDRMEHHVDRVRGEHGTEDIIPYQRVRQRVAAHGITLTAPGKGPVRVAVVIDNAAWTNDEAVCKVLRVYMLGHEVGHVLQNADGTGTDWRRWEGQANTHAVELQKFAATLRDEVDADWTANRTAELCLRDDAGNVGYPGNFFGEGFIEAAEDLSDELAKVAFAVQVYRVTYVGLDDIAVKAKRLVGELLLVLSHAAPLFAGANRFTELTERLRKSRTFEAYVGPHWDKLIDGLDDTDHLRGEATAAEVADAIFGRLGLVYEDLPDGNVFVHVHEPVLCEVDDGDDGPEREETRGRED